MCLSVIVMQMCFFDATPFEWIHLCLRDHALSELLAHLAKPLNSTSDVLSEENPANNWPHDEGRSKMHKALSNLSHEAKACDSRRDDVRCLQVWKEGAAEPSLR